MLDVKLLRDAPAELEANLEARRVAVFDDLPPGTERWAADTVERLVQIDQRYLAQLQQLETARARQNEIAGLIKELAKDKSPEGQARKATLIEEGRSLRTQEQELTTTAAQFERERDEAWVRLPNLTHPEVPRGHTDDDHRVVKTWGTRRDFAAEGFAPRDHVAIGEALDLIDFDGGRQGRRPGVLLPQERRGAAGPGAPAVRARDAGRARVHADHRRPTSRARRSSRGSASPPAGLRDADLLLEDTDLSLIGTAEITLGGMHADEILDEDACR